MAEVTPQTEPELVVGDSQRPRWLGLALGLATVALGATLVAGIPELRHAVSLALQGDLGDLRHQIRALGLGGVGLLLALTLAHAVLFYPAEITTATAGFAFGFLPGLALVMAGWLASALLAFLLGKTLARPVLYRLFGRRRFSSLERAVHRGGVPLLLASRLVPIFPFSLVGYVAGAAGVSVWRFAWTSVVGYLPLTAAIAYLGSRAQSLSLSDPFLWAVVGLVIALLATARWVRPNQATGEAGPTP